MKNEFKISRVIFFSIIFLGIILAADYYAVPSFKGIREETKSKIAEKTVAQNISPERLYVNVWRLVRNEYVDGSFNGQNWKRWRYRYANKIKTVDDAYVAINTMLASMNDPYTKFLKPGEYKKQKEKIESKISGIGIIFDKSGNEILVNNVMDNSPAQNAQIKPGDKIIGINGKPAENADIEKIIEETDASKKETVKLTIKRNDKIVEKELSKETIYIKTMDYHTDKNGIAVIRLSNINGEKALFEFKRILLETNNSKGLIIDLRNNYGGTLANAVQMADLMLSSQNILNIKSRKNVTYKVFSEEGQIFKEKPIVIIVNKYTASSAEIFAGILKEKLNAIIIGEKTYGKNSIQQIIPLYNDTGIVLTTDKYLLPSGKDISEIGLTPDIVIKNDIDIISNNDILVSEAKAIILKFLTLK